mgnify:CR=1 FL=1
MVHPDAFDALSPAARVHAQFIWRTAKIREALYDTSRLTNEDGELDRSRLNLIERQWNRPWVTGNGYENPLQPVVLVAEGGKAAAELREGAAPESGGGHVCAVCGAGALARLGHHDRRRRSAVGAAAAPPPEPR